jgi:hypothetical protein
LPKSARSNGKLAEVAAAIELPAAPIASLAAFEATPLEALRLRLQPGLAYASYDWPVDDLVRLYLDGNPPDTLHFEPARVLLEVRGARGAFVMGRIDHLTLAFRQVLAGGGPVADAIAAAEAVADGAFDAGLAVAALFSERLVIGIDAAEAT